jgi:hypothetical protein
MNITKPPALAKFLLQHLAVRNDALVGDLLEEFEHRKSPVWFWRQVLWIICLRFAHDLRTPWLAAGFAALWPYLVFVAARGLSLNSQYRSVLNWTRSHPWPEFYLYSMAVGFVTTAVLFSLGLGLYLMLTRNLDGLGFSQGSLVIFLGTALHGASLILVNLSSQHRGLLRTLVGRLLNFLLCWWLPSFLILLASMWSAARTSAYGTERNGTSASRTRA